MDLSSGFSASIKWVGRHPPTWFCATWKRHLSPAMLVPRGDGRPISEREGGEPIGARAWHAVGSQGAEEKARVGCTARSRRPPNLHACAGLVSGRRGPCCSPLACRERVRSYQRTRSYGLAGITPGITPRTARMWKRTFPFRTGPNHSGLPQEELRLLFRGRAIYE